MAAPKLKAADLAKLFQPDREQSLQDKRLIEALRQRLNEKLQDPQMARKAALILESWINKKR